jgi:hypothetical protein
MEEMKQLLAGVALLILVGLAGFLYRSVLEHPIVPPGTACTQEAKICPDGSAVGRTGPDCSFAPCPALATSTLDASTTPDTASTTSGALY